MGKDEVVEISLRVRRVSSLKDVEELVVVHLALAFVVNVVVNLKDPLGLLSF
ncbi:hypothetical protein QBC38DRAFT_456156 [Podospora fimiseda]|uniref:Uncharacterized protein n=1 Tax=Podospora fimiseda TaxID=252190 RepID=A0AAN7BMT4_9PEZI|nr:hypothetical protein QBC38DRAFT_456156 [Podospora fimiseda]